MEKLKPKEGVNFSKFHMSVASISARKNITELSEEELDRELPPRVLVPMNPQAVSNIVVYNHKNRAYSVNEKVPNLIVHYSSNSSIVQKHPFGVPLDASPVTPRANGASSTIQSARTGPNKSQNLVRNQFCFHDRSCETNSALVVDCGGSTNPPARVDMSTGVTRTIVYDKYVSVVGQRPESEEHTNPSDDDDTPAVESKHVTLEMDAVYSDSMRSACRVTERLVNLNQEEETYKKYKLVGGSECQILPLFIFSSLKTRNKQVTCIKWNSRYSDLFAVSYGSYDFSKQIEGCVAVFSLKNSKYPEIVIPTKSTVCCLDWHPKKSALLALGFYDGNVGVLDIRNSKSRELIYRSSSRKHFDPIWEIQWQQQSSDDDGSSNLSFHSISADGSIFKWILKKSQLSCEPMVKAPSLAHPTPNSFCNNCLCFDFAKFADRASFVLGTEEGKIFKCSKYYPNQFEALFEAHQMPVYAVRWNPFHSDVFLSASADWSVKVWNQKSASSSKSSPSCAFELNKGAVGDVDWCPINSTVFASANSEGTVHVFDLATNRLMEVCSRKITKKGKITRVKFSNDKPILLAGDDLGHVYCMKVCGIQSSQDNSERIKKVIDILNNTTG